MRMGMTFSITATVALSRIIGLSSGLAQENGPVFYCSYDGTVDAEVCDLDKANRSAAASDVHYVDGRSGKGIKGKCKYKGSLNLTADSEGAIMMWMRIPRELEKRHYYFFTYPSRLHIYVWSGTSIVFEVFKKANWKDKVYVACMKPSSVKWHHVCATWNRDFLCLFLDGRLAQTDTTSSFTAGNEAVCIDEIKIFDRALAQEEIGEEMTKRQVRVSLSSRPSARPVVSAGRTTAPPKIDGILNDTCWSQCIEITNFALLESNSLAQEQTKAYITYDDARLYLGILCEESNVGKLISLCQDRDGVVWTDDHFEIMLDTNNDKKTHYQLVFNALGALWDAACTEVEKLGIKKLKCDTTWNADCQLSTAKGENWWAAELCVSFESLGATAVNPGCTWGLNLCRDQKAASELSCWAPVDSRSFQDKKSWGRLVFRQQVPRVHAVCKPAIHLGRNNVRVVLGNTSTREQQWTLVAEIAPFVRKRADVKLEPGSRTEVELDLRLSKLPEGIRRGTFGITLYEKGANKEYFRYLYRPKTRYAEMYILDEEHVLGDRLYVATDYPMFQMFWFRHNFEGWNKGFRGRGEAKKRFRLVFHLPHGVGFVGHERVRINRDGRNYCRYVIERSRIRNRGWCRLLFDRTTLRPGEEREAAYYLECDEYRQPAVKINVKAITVGSAPQPKRLYTGIYDFTFGSLTRWLPNWEIDYGKLGFNTIAASAHCKGAPATGLVAKARSRGYRLRHDYFFPVDPNTWREPDARSWREWTQKDPDARARTLNRAFIRNPHYAGHPYMLCPSYRGESFRTTLHKFVKSGFIEKCGANWFALDLELYGKSWDKVCFCDRCLSQFRPRAARKHPELPFVSPKVFERDAKRYPQHHQVWAECKEWLLSEMLRIMKDEMRPVLRNAGLGEIILSDWGADHDACDLTEFGLYGKPEHCIELIDRVKEKFKPRNKPFVFNPTFGQMSPGYKDMGVTHKDVKYLALESAAAGAKGIIYFSMTCMGDALKFKNIVAAFRMIVPVEDIVADGKPIDGELSSSNPVVRVRGLRKGDEAIILVAEYGCSKPLETMVTCRVREPSEVIDLGTMRTVGKLAPGKPTFRALIQEEEAMLFHIRPVR